MLRLHSRAKIITFIGPVGVGKSTQMRLIQNRFRSCGVRTITTYLKSSHALAYILTKFLKGIGAYEEVKYADGFRIYPRRDIMKRLFPLYCFLDAMSVAVKFLLTICVPYALDFVILLEEGPIMNLHTYAEVMPWLYGTRPIVLPLVPNLVGWIEDRNHVNIILDADELELNERRRMRSFRRSELLEYERLQRNWVHRFRGEKTFFVDTRGLSIGQVQKQVVQTLGRDYGIKE